MFWKTLINPMEWPPEVRNAVAALVVAVATTVTTVLTAKEDR